MAEWHCLTVLSPGLCYLSSPSCQLQTITSECDTQVAVCSCWNFEAAMRIIISSCFHVADDYLEYYMSSTREVSWQLGLVAAHWSSLIKLHYSKRGEQCASKISLIIQRPRPIQPGHPCVVTHREYL